VTIVRLAAAADLGRPRCSMSPPRVLGTGVVARSG